MDDLHIKLLGALRGMVDGQPGAMKRAEVLLAAHDSPVRRRIGALRASGGIDSIEAANMLDTFDEAVSRFLDEATNYDDGLNEREEVPTGDDYNELMGFVGELAEALKPIRGR